MGEANLSRAAARRTENLLLQAEGICSLWLAGNNGLYRDYIGGILGLYRDNGQENGNYYIIIGLGMKP